MKFSLPTLLSLLALSSAQIDPDLVQLPSEDGIDFPGCFRNVALADRNGDGVVKRGEYLDFIQEYAKKHLCLDWPSLTLQQTAAFNSLACICRSLGEPTSCCLGSAAQLPTAGAVTPDTRTESQFQYLTAICIVTDGTLPPSQCPPDTTDPTDPPPPLLLRASVVSQPADDGLSTAALWGIIAGAIAAFLVFLLCCFCCVIRRRKQAALAEEKEVYDVTKAENVEQASETATGDLEGDDLAALGFTVVVAAASGGVGPDDDGSEDGRKRRGVANADEEDDEHRRRLRGEGGIPDDSYDPEHVKLKPIPPKDPKEDPAFDQPGRDVNYPKDQDEMSAGHVDHYEPEGGVYIPEREGKDPVKWSHSWEREKKEAPEEIDNRKRRVQHGFDEGEVWNQLGVQEDDKSKEDPSGHVSDWVVQSFLGMLENTDQAAKDEP